MQSKLPPLHLSHLTLQVENLEQALNFYVDLLGMTVQWMPDEKISYLTNGSDSLILQEVDDIKRSAKAVMSHFGFMVKEAQLVEKWYQLIVENNLSVTSPPQSDDRDGSKSFYFYDPFGNKIKIFYQPALNIFSDECE